MVVINGAISYGTRHSAKGTPQGRGVGKGERENKHSWGGGRIRGFWGGARRPIYELGGGAFAAPKKRAQQTTTNRTQFA